MKWIVQKKEDITASEKAAARAILQKQATFDQRLMYRFEDLIMRSLPLWMRVSLVYFSSFKKFPNLSSPSTFSEKIARYKMADLPQFVICADKVAVKEYVREKLGDEWLIPTIYAGSHLPAADIYTQWELPFVIKANHGSSWNLFIRTKADLNWNIIKYVITEWMRAIYGRESGEMHYSKIEPKILVEPFISPDGSLPLDYKFFVFNGEVKYIQVDTGREHDHKRALYDTDWRLAPASLGRPQETRPIKRPQSFEKMLAAAATLSDRLPFVRVDFYEVDGKPYFGEMTFFPSSGRERFTPEEFDAKLGSLWPETGDPAK